MTTAYIALGANLGDPLTQLRSALDTIESTPGIDLLAVSRAWRNGALGPPGQPDYWNAVCAVVTTLDAESLLARLQAIEDAAGRQRVEVWGPRLLDLDLLWMEGERRATPRLELPHPRLHERAFVLVPLAELAPELSIPGRGKVGELAAEIDRGGLIESLQLHSASRLAD